MVAILASGEGTTTEALIRARTLDKKIPAVGLVVCNNKNAGIFARVANLNREFGTDIKIILINSKTHPDSHISKPGEQTAKEEEAIIDIIKAGDFDLVLLMGYMKKLGEKLVYEFGWRSDYKSPYQAMMLNTHPGLLPETKGLIGIHVQQYVLAKKLPFAGETLHVVSANYDEGPIVAEHKVEIRPGDSAESLFERVKESQKKNLPSDLIEFIKKRQHFLRGKK